MADNMLPEESPNTSSTRRLNNVPVYILIFIMLVFVGLVVYGGIQKQKAQAERKAELKSKPVTALSSDKSATALLGSYIPPEPPKEKLEHKNDEKASGKDRKQTPEEKRAEQIRQKKMQDFMDSVAAQTSVKGGDNWSEKNKTKDDEIKTALNASIKKSESKDWDLHSEVEAPKSPYMLRAGHLIPVVLKQKATSTLSGNITAMVTQNIYDTATHKHLLIPQGTQMFGGYEGEVDFGEEVLFTGWNRLTFPDGKVLDIGEMPGLDEEGATGLHDKVNHHYLRIYGNAFLMSAVVGAVALSQNQNQGNQGGGFSQNSNSILSQSLGQTLGQATTRLLQKNINIAPTIDIRPGLNFNVMVTKDITFNGEFTSFDY